MGRFIYNISKFTFTALFICIIFLTILGTSSAGYIVSVCVSVVVSYFICFGQYLMGYEYSEGKNWYEYFIDFVTKLPIKNYKYKVDKIKYGDNSYRYYPRVRISLLGPLYYIYKRYIYKITLSSKHEVKYFKTKEEALYVIKEYNAKCINDKEVTERRKNKNRVKSKESINVSFKNN